MSPAPALRAALLGGVLCASSAGAQNVREDLAEEVRMPYEHLLRKQNELQLGVQRFSRDASSGVDKQTEAHSAFLVYSRGVTARLELGVMLPYTLDSQQTVTRGTGQVVSEEGRYGVADPVLRMRYVLTRDSTRISWTLGALGAPDWGGSGHSFGPQTAWIEPFVVAGSAFGATTNAYVRYGYLYRSGAPAEAHRLTFAGRQQLGPGYGVLASVTASRTLGSENSASHTGAGGTLGGFATLPNRMQLLLWIGRSGFSAQAGTRGATDDSRSRTLTGTLVHRF